MKKNMVAICFIALLFFGCVNAGKLADARQMSGNPIFPGWYADPEGAVFNNRYWVYPTFSAPYNQQVFFDAFSSADLVNWTKHSRILDTANVKWARRAVWAPAIVEKGNKYYLFFWCERYTKRS